MDCPIKKRAGKSVHESKLTGNKKATESELIGVSDEIESNRETVRKATGRATESGRCAKSEERRLEKIGSEQSSRKEEKSMSARKSRPKR